MWSEMRDTCTVSRASISTRTPSQSLKPSRPRRCSSIVFSERSTSSAAATIGITNVGVVATRGGAPERVTTSARSGPTFTTLRAATNPISDAARANDAMMVRAIVSSTPASYTPRSRAGGAIGQHAVVQHPVAMTSHLRVLGPREDALGPRRRGAGGLVHDRLLVSRVRQPEVVAHLVRERRGRAVACAEDDPPLRSIAAPAPVHAVEHAADDVDVVELADHEHVHDPALARAIAQRVSIGARVHVRPLATDEAHAVQLEAHSDRGEELVGALQLPGEPLGRLYGLAVFDRDEDLDPDAVLRRLGAVRCRFLECLREAEHLHEHGRRTQRGLHRDR